MKIFENSPPKFKIWRLEDSWEDWSKYKNLRNELPNIPRPVPVLASTVNDPWSESCSSAVTLYLWFLFERLNKIRALRLTGDEWQKQREMSSRVCLRSAMEPRCSSISSKKFRIWILQSRIKSSFGCRCRPTIKGSSSSWRSWERTCCEVT